MTDLILVLFPFCSGLLLGIKVGSWLQVRASAQQRSIDKKVDELHQ